jgi:hypothetical protein
MVSKMPTLLMNTLLVFLYILNAYPSTTYYLSPSGDDLLDGKSRSTAWRSLHRLNNHKLAPGDRVLLEGGAVFEGTLLLDVNDGSEGRKPLIISSYGKGKARIEAGSGSGIFAVNVSGLCLSNLIVNGNGVGQNGATGIEFLANDPSISPSDIRIENCEVKGFGKYGILINAANDWRCGYSRVRIAQCTATGNGEAGIASLAMFPNISHRDLEVVYCKAFLNKGILTKTENHSGNGIVLSGADGVRIAHCEAWENGEHNRSLGGGPVGIWLWACRNGVIERCTAHHNHAGRFYDGGGFDLDGGAENCTIRHCHSYQNEGAGYLLCEFGSTLPFRNNVVEHCTSTNDGLKNSYGGITLSAPREDFRITNTIVRHNKVTVSGENVVDGRPTALYFDEHHYRGIEFYDNEFKVEVGADLLRCDTVFQREWASFRKNRFQLPPGEFPVRCERNPGVAQNQWKVLLGLD